MTRLGGKAAMVTGAAQGIGQGITLRLVEEGADIDLNLLQDDAAAQAMRQRVATLGMRLMNYPALEKLLIARIRRGRLGTLADLAGVAAFLASDDVDYVTATTTVVDGRLLWNYAEQCGPRPSARRSRATSANARPRAHRHLTGSRPPTATKHSDIYNAA